MGAVLALKAQPSISLTRDHLLLDGVLGVVVELVLQIMDKRVLVFHKHPNHRFQPLTWIQIL